MADEVEVVEGWETDSGFLDDVDFTVTEAFFTKDARIKNGEVLLLSLKGTVDDGEETDVLIQCGPGWDSFDGGKTAVHGDKKTKFANQSHYGLWIDQCIKELKIGGVLAGRGPATKADVWVGLKFHLKQKQFSGTIAGEARTWAKLLPDAFLGAVGDGKSAAASNGSAKAEANGSASNGSGNKVLIAKLKKLAKDSDTHESFVDAAMEIPGVTDDDDVLGQVIAEDGIYAMAQA